MDARKGKGRRGREFNAKKAPAFRPPRRGKENEEKRKKRLKIPRGGAPFLEIATELGHIRLVRGEKICA